MSANKFTVLAEGDSAVPEFLRQRADTPRIYFGPDVPVKQIAKAIAAAGLTIVPDGSGHLVAVESASPIPLSRAADRAT